MSETKISSEIFIEETGIIAADANMLFCNGLENIHYYKNCNPPINAMES